MRLCRIPKKVPKTYGHDRQMWTTAGLCHELGPYVKAAPDLFVCEACAKAADEYIRLLAEKRSGIPGSSVEE
jgi:hypothetical protein